MRTQVSSFGSLPRARSSASMGGRSTAGGESGPSMSKVESIASTAVRAADKIQARLPLARARFKFGSQVQCLI